MNQRRIHQPLVNRQHVLISLVVTALFAILLVGCGSDEGYTIRELEATSEAAATEAAQERDDAIEARIAQMQSLAPEGAVVSESPPGGQHDADFRYEFGQLPPNGGVHHPQWQKCGIYDAPVAIHHAIHSIEHGAVWIAYNPDIAAADLEELEDESNGEPFVLLAPYPDLPSPVVLTAWGVQLEVDSATDDRVREFIRTFTNGPQTPEPGANCASGITATVDA